MKSLRLPAAAASRQMNLLFDNSRLEGVASAERKIISVLAQILMQAAGLFTRFRELGNARQVLLSMKADQIHFPRPSDEGRMTSFDWVPIRYRNVVPVLKNPFTQGFMCTGKARNAPRSSKGGTAELRAWQADRDMGGDDQRSSRRLYRLGRI
jgi:hypothetical protein